MQQKNPNILKYVHISWQRCGVNLPSPDSHITKLLKYTFWVFSIFVTVMNLFFIIGSSLVIKNATDSSAVTGLHNSIITVAVFSLFSIICCILLKSNRLIPSIIAGILNTAVCVFLLVFFYNELNDGLDLLGLTAKYVFRHAIPLIVMLISGNLSAIIIARFIIFEDRAYNKMIDNLYRLYSAQYQELSDTQWQEFLDNYEPVRPKKLKRSRKAKNK